MEEIILASTSIRRKQIFQQMHLPFRIMAPTCDEKGLNDTDPENAEKVVKDLAFLKGKSVFPGKKNEKPVWIAGFDTIVEVDGKIIGKAHSEQEARRMLSLLSGRIHSVYTGIALFSNKREKWDIRVAKSEVKFTYLAEKEINFYLSTKEWKGAAGSYKIQERGAFFIEWIKGSYSNIVGLPISLFYVMLKDNDYSFSLRQGN